MGVRLMTLASACPFGAFCAPRIDSAWPSTEMCFAMSPVTTVPPRLAIAPTRKSDSGACMALATLRVLATQDHAGAVRARDEAAGLVGNLALEKTERTGALDNLGARAELRRPHSFRNFIVRSSDVNDSSSSRVVAIATPSAASAESHRMPP